MNSCHSGKTSGFEAPKDCVRMSFTRTPTGQIVADMDCASARGDGRMTMHSVTSGDFQTSMVSDGTLTLQAEGKPARVFKTHTEAKYLGPCPAGMEPDDMAHAAGPGAAG